MSFLLSFQGKVLQGGLLLSSDGFQTFQAFFVFVQPFPQGSGFSWFQVNWLDGFASVELLEFSFSGLVDDGQDFGDVFSDNVDFSEFGGTLGGNLGDFEGGELLS